MLLKYKCVPSIILCSYSSINLFNNSPLSEHIDLGGFSIGYLINWYGKTIRISTHRRMKVTRAFPLFGDTLDEEEISELMGYLNFKEISSEMIEYLEPKMAQTTIDSYMWR